MSNSCTPDECYSNLWQFKCPTCPGKMAHHKYRLWYERVTPEDGERPKSMCYSCKEKEDDRRERLDEWNKEVKANPGLRIIEKNNVRKLIGRDGRRVVAEIAVQDFIPIEYMKEAVQRGQEEGVFICFFVCKCFRQYVVRCKMQNTAECYGCNRERVSPCHFQPRTRINKKTDNVHSCSECNGQPGCPNMSKPIAFQ